MPGKGSRIFAGMIYLVASGVGILEGLNFAFVRSANGEQNMLGLAVNGIGWVSIAIGIYFLGRAIEVAAPQAS